MRVSYMNWVVATQIFFIFTPKIGEMIQFDDHIFQMGWNYQLVKKNIPCFVGTSFSILPSNLDQTSICQISGVLEFGTLVIHGSSYSLSRPPFPIFQWQMKVCVYIGIPKPKHVSYSLNENVWKVCTPKVLIVRPWKRMVRSRWSFPFWAPVIDSPGFCGRAVTKEISVESYKVGPLRSLIPING